MVGEGVAISMSTKPGTSRRGGRALRLRDAAAEEEGGQVYVELPPPEMLDPLLATEVNEIKAGTAEAAANGVIMNGAGVVMNGAAGHSCGGGCGGAGLDW